MGKPRMRMFAGPNGSGKSELIREIIEKQIPLGPVINADQIAKNIDEKGFLDLGEYQLKNITQSHWDDAINRYPQIKSRIEKSGVPAGILIKENTLICKLPKKDAYAAALIADFLRYSIIEQKISFSFETVMSHPGKVEFLHFVAQKGYTTYLYYIATESPYININRVENRVAKGGHDVPVQKIKSRYYRSLDLLLDALKAANRAYLIDNSKKSNFVIFEKKHDGMGYPQTNKMPLWFEKYVLNKLG